MHCVTFCIEQQKEIIILDWLVYLVTRAVPILTGPFGSFSLQVGGGQVGGVGQIQIFSLNHTTPRMLKAFPLPSCILCVENVCAKESEESSENEEDCTFSPVQPAVCVGLQDGR